MVGSLKALKHKVPILLSGKRLNLFTEKMEPLGFNLNVVGEQAGMASGNKLIRSVFTKGLAALLIETLVYAKKLGYYEVVLESIIKTLKADPADLIGRLISGTMLHSHRRIGELSGSKEMLDDAGLDSRMIEAAMEVLKNVDSFDFDKETITVNISASIEELDSYYK
jgi:3-hydroxyisobutyrate dehydrogenase-like beta-hydroxyacid dehydrogenase